MSGGFTPKLIETTDPLSGWINVLASEHGMNKSVGITIDASSVSADGNGNKIVPNGTVLMKVASTGKYKPYAASFQKEVQIVGDGSATAGTFKITYDGQQTAAIAYDATAATVQAALEDLDNVAVGDVTCSGGALPGTAVTITFNSGEDVPVVTLAGTGLTGGTLAVTNPAQGYRAAGILVNGGVNLKDGDVITGMLIHGSVLEARVIGLDAEAKAALSHIIFQ